MIVKRYILAWVQWCTLIVPDTREAEAEGLEDTMSNIGDCLKTKLTIQKFQNQPTKNLNQ